MIEEHCMLQLRPCAEVVLPLETSSVVIYTRSVWDKATLDLFLNWRAMMHEVTVRSMLDRPLIALGAACMKLMRIIPDNEPGYSDTLATVKRYLLDGAASAFCAVVFRALF